VAYSSIDWPAIPDDALAGTYVEEPANNVLRTDMDVGPAKTRRRTTTGADRMAFDLNLTAANITTLMSFYRTTCYGGSLAFNFVHPRTGSSVVCRFLAPPKLTPDGTGQNVIASLQMEILP
jgi:hypothetical protein